MQEMDVQIQEEKIIMLTIRSFLQRGEDLINANRKWSYFS
jgi:hypothetical protein